MFEVHIPLEPSTALLNLKPDFLTHKNAQTPSSRKANYSKGLEVLGCGRNET